MVVVSPPGGVVMLGQTELPFDDGHLEPSRTVEATAKLVQPVHDGDWACAFCHTYRGLSAFGTPCPLCGGYSMASFQALTLRVHSGDRIGAGPDGTWSHVGIRPAGP